MKEACALNGGGARGSGERVQAFPFGMQKMFQSQIGDGRPTLSALKITGCTLLIKAVKKEKRKGENQSWFRNQ